ncbi:MAG: ABC transporter permease [Dehalococcoidia bacterium]
MQRYILNRLLLLIPSLLGLSLLVFILIRLVPGDTVTALMAESGVFSDEQVATLRARWHLDESYLQQYIRYMSDLARGDLGQSFYYGTPVADEIARGLPATLEIAAVATLLSIALAVPMGTISAVRAGSWIDVIVRALAVLGQAIPSFWLGTMVVVGLAFYLQWLPPKGYVSPFVDLRTNLTQIIFPAIVLAWSLSAVSTRLIRNSLLEVLRQDYMRTAVAKGITGRAAVLRHGLRNALLPVVTVAGAQLAFLLGGSVIVESIFSVPGLGSLALKSIELRDYNLLQGIVLVFGVLAIVANLLVDLSYAVIDPRIRYS